MCFWKSVSTVCTVIDLIHSCQSYKNISKRNVITFKEPWLIEYMLSNAADVFMPSCSSAINISLVISDQNRMDLDINRKENLIWVTEAAVECIGKLLNKHKIMVTKYGLKLWVNVP